MLSTYLLDRGDSAQFCMTKLIWRCVVFCLLVLFCPKYCQNTLFQRVSLSAATLSKYMPPPAPSGEYEEDEL